MRAVSHLWPKKPRDRWFRAYRRALSQISLGVGGAHPSDPRVFALRVPNMPRLRVDRANPACRACIHLKRDGKALHGREPRQSRPGAPTRAIMDRIAAMAGDMMPGAVERYTRAADRLKMLNLLFEVSRSRT